MKLLWSYLRQYMGLVALALVLAAVNQVFSLLDPLIFRHVIDSYAMRFREYSTGVFIRGWDFCSWPRSASPLCRAWLRTFRTTSSA